MTGARPLLFAESNTRGTGRHDGLILRNGLHAGRDRLQARANY